MARKKLLGLRTKWAQIIGEFTFDDIIRELEKPDAICAIHLRSSHSAMIFSK